MRIHVVCRLNQARSIIAAATLRKLYPEVHITSSGIEANSGRYLPIFIEEIAQRWGLTNMNHYSNHISEIKDLATYDHLFAADDYVLQHLERFQLPCTPINVQEFALENTLIPHEPIAMSPTMTEIELAKMVDVTVRALSKLSSITGNNEVCVLRYQGPIESIIDRARDWINRIQGFVIDINLAIPNLDLWSSSGLPVKTFNHRSLLTNDSSVPQVLVSEYEVDQLEDFLTSRPWAHFLKSLSAQRPVLLLIHSEKSGNMSMATPILSHIHATRLWNT